MYFQNSKYVQWPKNLSTFKSEPQLIKIQQLQTDLELSKSICNPWFAIGANLSGDQFLVHHCILDLETLTEIFFSFQQAFEIT